VKWRGERGKHRGWRCEKYQTGGMGRGGVIEGGRGRKEIGFGEKDGQEFGEVEVTLISVVELHVPNEFVVRGHVVVSDHVTIPTGIELHSDVASDEVMGEGERGACYGGDEGVETGKSPRLWAAS
jgi:hypothetical protein